MPMNEATHAAAKAAQQMEAAPEWSGSIWTVLETMQGEIAAEVRVMLGEGPYDQKMFDEEQRQRRIKAMKDCAANSSSDAERHDSWIKMHRETGWVYGEEFNPKMKTHPNLKPWDELPATAKSKARIFDIVSKAGPRIESEFMAAILQCLNTAFDNDPNAIHALMVNRVPCNQGLADHPNVTVDQTPVLNGEHSQVGAIGLINGILNAIGLPMVGIKFSDEKDVEGRSIILGFCQANQIYCLPPFI